MSKRILGYWLEGTHLRIQHPPCGKFGFIIIINSMIISKVLDRMLRPPVCVVCSDYGTVDGNGLGSEHVCLLLYWYGRTDHGGCRLQEDIPSLSRLNSIILNATV